MPKLLFVIPQLPHDPASGAARSTRGICELLAARGYEVDVVATTASESASHLDPIEYLGTLGISPSIESPAKGSGFRRTLHFHYRGIAYSLLDVARRDLAAWQQLQGRQFDLPFDAALHRVKPEILLAYGGHPNDEARYRRARRQGVKVVFALRNSSYLAGATMLREMDAILTPSEFLTNFYRTAIDVQSTALPTPMDLDDVVAADRQAIFFTMINPSPEKGLYFVARLAEELSLRRPDLPMMFIESRGSAGRLVQVGLNAGFDLRRHDNLMMAPPLAQPKEIYAGTRALLAPSLWQEPAGRVAAEALLNGTPPIVSDRGGLGEMCNGAGFVVPIPPYLRPESNIVASAEDVAPWLDLMERLEGDGQFYERESQRALAAASVYLPENLGPRYVDFFDALRGQ